MQQTVCDDVFLKGVGIHSGEVVHLKICPAPIDSGIVFKRG